MELTEGNVSYIFIDNIQGFFDRYGDPRVRDWFLMDSPVPLLVLLASYFYFCTRGGPEFMKSREPFQLKNLMIVYNAAHVIACVWLIHEGGWMTGYNFTCQPVDTSNSPQALRMTHAAWWYFLFKVVELLDTVLFVLRKKDKQITYLHLYHHTHVPLLTWTAAKFWPGGHGSMAGLLNTVVHIIMYTYYLLSAMGPKWQKFLWWKKYVTSIQLMQFVIVVFHQGQIFYNGCDFPKLLPLINVLNSSYFIYLFGSFYVETYTKKKTFTVE